MGVRTRDFANAGSNGINWIKKGEHNQTGNTATSFQFNTGLYDASDGFNYYRIVGRLGGTQSTGNANLRVRWVNSSGNQVTSGYYSANFAAHSGSSSVIGAGSNAGYGYILKNTPTTASMMCDLYYLPQDGHLFGFARYHNQSTQLGVCTTSVRNATSYAYGLNLTNSGGTNVTEIDFTVYGAKIDGSLGL